tara:strand:+ start:75 stop:419 length:345 start_codon:yes stop_codon:yes gene_type:complete
MKARRSYNLELYLGSINQETKRPFTRKELAAEISIFQDEYSRMIPVCISDVEFVCGTKYSEKGWKVSVINFPKINIKAKELDKFMKDLARVLLYVFKQNTICVVGSKNTIMLER